MLKYLVLLPFIFIPTATLTLFVVSVTHKQTTDTGYLHTREENLCVTLLSQLMTTLHL